MADHKLMNQLNAAEGVTNEEIEELFNDLKFIFGEQDNPFDKAIELAIVERGCAYIDNPNPPIH